MNNRGFIIIRMFGGLGNQLWQYAIGRSLSLRYKKKLVLDISYFKKPLIDLPIGGTFRFELNNLQLDKDTLIENNCYNHSYRFFKYFLRFIPNRLINLFFVGKRYKIDNFIFEENLIKKKNFDKSIKSNKTNYLIGYWQNKKYFAKYYEIIKHELKPVFINKHVHKFIKNIKKNNVAIHIRGGDLSIEKNYSHPDKEYYLKIISFLKKKNIFFSFHVFTDDVEYADELLKKIKLKNYTIVSKKYNFSNIEEFYIMQHYKYFTMNRSTFSWWSGHLSNEKKTIIFAPKIWKTNMLMPISIRSNNMKLF